jgi:hypothetical protein
MKTIIKQSLKQLVADRYLLVLLSAMLLLALVLAIIIGLLVQPSSGVQLVSHFSAFGGRHYYTDQWFYLYVFVVFELVVAVLHFIITIKLLIVKGHSIAVMFAWLGIGVELLGLVTALAVINAYI